MFLPVGYVEQVKEVGGGYVAIGVVIEFFRHHVHPWMWLAVRLLDFASLVPELRIEPDALAGAVRDYCLSP
jgi:hypothetical protein